MYNASVSARMKGFTLIELLIVVAIIAILAAIAVPNFLEAQTRSKVTRLYADMRSVKVALEAYRVDTNNYPETDYGQWVLTADGVGMKRTTTPIAYITSLPRSPFDDFKIGKPSSTSPRDTDPERSGTFLYVRARVADTSNLPAGWSAADATADTQGFHESYKQDRIFYLIGQASITPGNTEFSRSGFYMFKSVGPNNVDDRASTNPWPQAEARMYDPTNGTISKGDILTFQDTSIPAAQRQF